jgi:hypothetical protein
LNRDAGKTPKLEVIFARGIAWKAARFFIPDRNTEIVAAGVDRMRTRTQIGSSGNERATGIQSRSAKKKQKIRRIGSI